MTLPQPDDSDKPSDTDTEFLKSLLTDDEVRKRFAEMFAPDEVKPRGPCEKAPKPPTLRMRGKEA